MSSRGFALAVPSSVVGLYSVTLFPGDAEKLQTDIVKTAGSAQLIVVTGTV